MALMETQLAIFLRICYNIQLMLMSLFSKNYQLILLKWTFFRWIESCRSYPNPSQKRCPDKKNFRHVSVLPNLSKVFDRFMYIQIESFMECNLSKLLTGFTENHRSQHCVANLFGKFFVPCSWTCQRPVGQWITIY